MNPPRIRPLALCVFRKGDQIFISKGYDPKKNETFYRPIGGGIEFGETGQDAVTREVREELNAEIHQVKFLAVLENIFTFNGKPGHEIVFLYQADFLDPAFEEEREHAIIESGVTVAHAKWEPLDLFLRDGGKMYPSGILDLLKDRWKL